MILQVALSEQQPFIFELWLVNDDFCGVFVGGSCCLLLLKKAGTQIGCACDRVLRGLD